MTILLFCILYMKIKCTYETHDLSLKNLLFFAFLGKGTNFWKKNGALYDGDWRNNKRCGFGTLSIPGEDGDYKRVYAGGWKADKRHVRKYHLCVHQHSVY